MSPLNPPWGSDQLRKEATPHTIPEPVETFLKVTCSDPHKLLLLPPVVTSHRCPHPYSPEETRRSGSREVLTPAEVCLQPPFLFTAPFPEGLRKPRVCRNYCGYPVPPPVMTSSLCVNIRSMIYRATLMIILCV